MLGWQTWPEFQPGSSRQFWEENLSVLVKCWRSTVDSKIVRALEIDRVEKLTPKAVLWEKKNVYKVIIIRLYTVYTAWDNENWQSNQRKIASIIASARIILLYFENCVLISLGLIPKVGPETCHHNFDHPRNDCENDTLNTVGSKIIRALVIILAIFLWFDCQFLSSCACCKQ